MSLSATAGHLLHIVLDRRSTETTILASQLKAHPQTAPVERLSQSYGIVELLDCEMHIRATDQKLTLKLNLTPMFTDRVRIVPCPDVTVADV